MSDPARRHPLVRLLAFPPGAPAPLLALVALSCSLVGVFVVPLLLPDAAPGWLRLVVGVLVVLGLMMLTAALLRRAHARGRSPR
ncbi:hypothetical protein SAMN05216207_102750 [Pseudonocardia ammonioxydans]|uniref:Uncharacterized protein n=1 Tax=Pseudonocardia ammonioxydans TaxID=260086 RepID=A0A1I5DRZ9_PSUAM|nr:hypothetical protein [Pseudonocardia ammonioxydans]SFO01993.1 hypothetical protein SAMN05216207_102750 [Pseudonocardia ammonioxydans]